MKSPRNIRTDRNGGIEGLPLQLMIVILVATMGTAIILGWMGGIETPKMIGDVDAPGVVSPENGTIGSVEITVYDQDGNPLEGAVVILTGMGVTDAGGNTAYAETDSHGKATFTSLRVTNHGTHGFITVNVSMPGYGEDSSTKIAVIS